VLYYQGHFQQTFTGFRATPQAAGGNGGRGERGGGGSADYAYKLYQDWTSGRLPRMLIVITQDANPFYDAPVPTITPAPWSTVVPSRKSESCSSQNESTRPTN
jgi:hypothetical protein